MRQAQLKKENFDGLQRIQQVIHAERKAKNAATVKTVLHQISHSQSEVSLRIKGTSVTFDALLHLKKNMVLLQIANAPIPRLLPETILQMDYINEPNKSQKDRLLIELVVSNWNEIETNGNLIVACKIPKKITKSTSFQRLAERKDVSDRDHFTIGLRGFNFRVLDFSMTGIRFLTTPKQAEMFKDEEIFHHVPFTAGLHHVQVLFLKIKRVTPHEVCARIGFTFDENKKIRLLTNDNRSFRFLD